MLSKKENEHLKNYNKGRVLCVEVLDKYKVRASLDGEERSTSIFSSSSGRIPFKNIQYIAKYYEFMQIRVEECSW